MIRFQTSSIKTMLVLYAVLIFLIMFSTKLLWADSLSCSTKDNITAGNTAAASDVKGCFDEIVTWSSNISDTNIKAGAAISAAKISGTAVTLSGAQTISGDKTISGDTTHSGSLTISGETIMQAGLNWEDLTQIYGNAIFEGATADAYETTISITDPTADRTLTVPDADVDLTSYSEVTLGAWATVTVSGGTPTLADSYNVSGITDTAQGVVTITIDNDFEDADYAPVCVADRSGTASNLIPGVYGQAAGSFAVVTTDYSNSPKDPIRFNCVVGGNIA